MKHQDAYCDTAPHVHVGEGEWIPTDKVIFVDICEDFQGYDLMTFIHKGKQMQSKITNRPI